MLSFSGSLKVVLAVEPCDLRKSCHRSLQNQPVGVESKPAILRWSIHIGFLETDKSFSIFSECKCQSSLFALFSAPVSIAALGNSSVLGQIFFAEATKRL